MRIVGGSHRGLKLADVGAGDANAHLRPTSDRVRESIFNLLINGKPAVDGNPVTGARVLDLFAGTGALALEALSRGAAIAVLIDTGRAAQALIRQNIALARRQPDTNVLNADALRLPPNRDAAFDLIFLDPPYGKGMGGTALAAARAGGWIAPGALVVWEENAPQTAPEGFALVDQRKYGETVVTILKAAE